MTGYVYAIVDEQLARWSCRSGAYLVANTIDHHEFALIVKFQSSIDAAALEMQREKRAQHNHESRAFRCEPVSNGRSDGQPGDDPFERGAGTGDQHAEQEKK